MTIQIKESGSYQIKEIGGSIALVYIYTNLAPPPKQKTQYITAIEPKSTKERLYEIRALWKPRIKQYGVNETLKHFKKSQKRTTSVRPRETIKIESKALTKTRSGYRMPKASEKTVHGKRQYPVPSLQKPEKLEKIQATKDTYSIEELKRAQIIETEIAMRKPLLKDKKTSETLRKKTIKDIAHHQSELKIILGTKYKSCKDIADARQKGKIRVI